MNFGKDFSYRSHQREAVEFAINSFNQGKDVVLFEAPTGFGKSLVNTIVADMCSDAFYTSPQVSLVDQLASDPLLKEHVCSIYGRRNYPCVLKVKEQEDQETVEPGSDKTEKEKLTADVGPCVVKKNYKCPMASECLYHIAKRTAAGGRIATMTLAYLLVASTSHHAPLDDWGLVRGRFPPRELLVIDEAHGAAEFACRFVSLKLSAEYTLRGVPTWKETWKGIKDTALAVRDADDVVEVLGELTSELRKDLVGLRAIWESDPKDDKIPRDLIHIESLIDRIMMAITDLEKGNPWAIDPKKKEQMLVLQPVLIGRFLQERLWDRASRYLLTSATILDPDLFLRELGLDGKDVAVKRIPSGFPAENAPIIDATVGPLTRKCRDANLPKALRALSKVMDKEEGRGLVHCHSYENATYIKKNIPSSYRGRLTFHESTNRNDVLDEWLENGKKDSVLVSVAMTDGLDLHDDLAQWCVIFKVPYPFLGDKRVKLRLELPDGNHWYALSTLKAVIQASGRIIRSEDDEGRVYVLDGSIHKLLSQTAKWVPNWFEGRLGGTLLDL